MASEQGSRAGRSTRSAGARSAGTLVKRIVVGVVVVAALVFAVQGGEYGTLDLLRQRHERTQLNHSIDSLQRIVDSLARYEHAVEHDPATQERIAREVFGMVRGKEILYRFTDSSGTASRSR